MTRPEKEKKFYFVHLIVYRVKLVQVMIKREFYSSQLAARLAAKQFQSHWRRRRYKDGRAELCHKDGSGFGPAQRVKNVSFPGM